MKYAADHVREAAASWVNDNLSMDRNSINGLGISREQVKTLTNPCYWDCRDMGETYGGVHTFATHCRLPGGLTFKFEVCHMLPEGLFFVQSASVESESSNAKYTFSINESQKSVREKDRQRKITGCEAVVEWYLSRYNPELDHDMGTEPSDWERVDSWRAEATDTSMKSKWLRMPNRTDDSFDGSFLEPGILEMTSHPDGTNTFQWSKKPSGVYEMEADAFLANQLDRSGIGGWA